MVNKVILVGNLGKDPELKFTSKGIAVCSFSIATTERWKDANGEQREQTTWHKIVAWRKLGEICGQYLAKGKQVYVEGKLSNRQWETTSGEKRYATEIVADQVKFLSGGSSRSSDDSGASDTSESSTPESSPPSDDDVPW